MRIIQHINKQNKRIKLRKKSNIASMIKRRKYIHFFSQTCFSVKRGDILRHMIHLQN